MRLRFTARGPSRLRPRARTAARAAARRGSTAAPEAGPRVALRGGPGPAVGTRHPPSATQPQGVLNPPLLEALSTFGRFWRSRGTWAGRPRATAGCATPLTKTVIVPSARSTCPPPPRPEPFAFLSVWFGRVIPLREIRRGHSIHTLSLDATPYGRSRKQDAARPPRERCPGRAAGAGRRSD